MKVLVTDPLAPEAVETLRKSGHEVDARKATPEELLKIIKDYDALLVRSETKVTKAVIESGSRLKVVGRAGVGVDNIDVEAARAKGVAVVNAPLAATNAVAELTLAHMLALARNLHKADATMKAGQWEKKGLRGVELQGRTLGLIGVGRIGGRVAELARAFGMRVAFYDPYVPREREASVGGSKVDRVDDLVASADFVSIHVPLTPETRNLVNAALLAKFKPTAFLLNLSRGGIVDERALADALAAGKLAGVALDVFAEEPPKSPLPFLGAPNASLSPHVGASTDEAQVKAGVTVAEDVVKVLRGERPEFRVA